MSRKTWVRIIAGLLAAWPALAVEPYQELYRPQFHFSPRSGWMGDPDGLVRYRGLYHLFWWGHAVSTDLVFWRELPWPMKGGDDSFMYYTGSVVVDQANTGGWGAESQPAMVAIYTAHERRGGLENQRLSISTNYTDFHYYSGNPVLDQNSRSFRDPDVFRDESRGRWVMAITYPDDRQVGFFASTDLKAWQPLSTFGPAGAQDGLWEVPVLFSLPVNGDPADTKWVLACSMGPNKVQYFVGDFDGSRFRLDAAENAFLNKGAGLEGEVWEDFEGRTLAAWTASGTAFEQGPVHVRAAGRRAATGFLGKGLGSSSSR